VAVAATLAAVWLRQAVVAVVALVVSLLGVVFTFFALKSMTEVAAKVAPQKGSSWKNLGVGGFAACIALVILAAAAVQVLLSRRRAEKPVPSRPGADLPDSMKLRCR